MFRQFARFACACVLIVIPLMSGNAGVAASTTNAYDASYNTAATPKQWGVGQAETFAVQVTNTGAATWNSGGGNDTELVVSFVGQPGSQVSNTAYTTKQFPLPGQVVSGATASISITIAAPNGQTGSLYIEYQMVHHSTRWFASYAAVPVTVSSLVFDPPALDFGRVIERGGSAARSVVVTNASTSLDGGVELSITGADPSAFVLQSSTCGGPLASGGSCEATYAFKPGQLGTLSATLVATADPGGTSDLALSGLGVPPPVLSMTPTSVDFSNFLTGQSTGAQTFTVTNTSPDTTTVPAVNLVDAPGFSITSNGCTVALAGGASCQVSIAFQPQDTTLSTGLLAFVAPPSAPVFSILNGEVYGPTNVSIEYARIDFGQQQIDTQSPNGAITIFNSGVASGPLSASISGTNSDQFAVAKNDCAGGAPAGSACMIEVQFAPSSTGFSSAELNVAGAPGGPLTADLTGSGVGGPTVPTWTVSPTGWNFDNTVVGTTSDKQVFTLTNGGLTPVAPPSISFDAGSFSLSNNGCTSVVLPGGACSFDISFAPASAGWKGTNATVSSPEHSVELSLFGTGLSPAVLVAKVGSVDFGTSAVGEMSGSFAAVVTNAGDAPAHPTGFSLTGPDAGDFAAQWFGCRTPLSSGATCVIGLRASPSHPGAETAQSTFFSDPGGPASVQLSVTGFVASPALLTALPGSIDFGDSTGVGAHSHNGAATIHNSGSEPSGTISLSISGPDADQFVSPLGNGGQLAGGADEPLRFIFAPTSLGPKTATFTFTADPGGSGSIQLTATAVTPAALSISPTSATFPDTRTDGWTTADKFTVANSGQGSSGSLQGVNLGPDMEDFWVDLYNGCPAELSGNSTCWIVIGFLPQTPGHKQAAVGVTSPYGGTAVAAVDGTGVLPPYFTISPTSFDFGNQLIGVSHPSHDFTVTNTGGIAWNASISLTASSDFSVSTSSCYLAPGASCTVTVTFRATSLGQQQATLNAYDRWANVATAVISATGSLT